MEFYNDDFGYVNFIGSDDIARELKEKYTFFAPNYQFHPKFKAGYWDGKISLINLKNRNFYAGIFNDVKRYLDDQGLEYKDNTNITLNNTKITDDEIISFYKEINGPFKPHDSQVLALKKCIEDERNIIIAPTSNGKSYIIHALVAWHRKQGRKTLVMIDRANLVLQLKSNFEDEYNSKPLYETKTIYDEDETNCDCLISTWQSLIKKPAKYFKQFDVIIGDEIHKHKAKSLIDIFNMCKHIRYRHGFTGTLSNNSESDELTLMGLYGDKCQTTTLREQIDEGVSSRPNIFIFVLQYPHEDIMKLKQLKEEARKSPKYKDSDMFIIESDFINFHEKRNQFIKKIIKLQKGNTLITFKNLKHGKSLYKLLEDTSLPMFYFSSKIHRDKRQQQQNEITGVTESLIIASLGVFSTGVNIPSLNNLVITSQIKSNITIPQTIGRMLRKTDTKSHANVIDFCDDFRIKEKNPNIFYNHFQERLNFYLSNGFDIKVKYISL